MSKKIEITESQARQFNRMLESLIRIKSYDSPNKLRKDSEKDWGLEYQEALEMSYENIQEEAKSGTRGIKKLNITINS